MDTDCKDTWTDLGGRIWRTPSGDLNCSKQAGHSALRKFVFGRDDFTCQGCRLGFPADAATYDGRLTVPSIRVPGPEGFRRLELDHVIPRARGGSHHPSNLQALCNQCNVSKGWRLNAARTT